MARLRHINDWAAFIALERELKLDLPEGKHIGNPWLLGSEEERDPKHEVKTSLVSRCIGYWKTGQ